MEHTLKALLFDLDGTVLDTRDLILDSFRYAYKKVIDPDTIPPDEKLLALIGIPLKTQMEMIAPDKSEELFEAYIENNVRVQDEMIKGFAGMEEALQALLDQGFRLGIVTSKRHEPAQHGLELMGLDSYFEIILGSDDTSEHKPKPGPLLEAAEKMGLAIEDCAYVGDSPYDMQSAVSARMFAIGVTWGIFTEQELRDAGAAVILDDISQLPPLFESAS